MKSLTQKILLFGLLNIFIGLHNLNAIALINNTDYKMSLHILYKDATKEDSVILIKNEAEIIEFNNPNNVEKLNIQVSNEPYILLFDLTQILNILSKNQITYLSLTFCDSHITSENINDWKKYPPLLKPTISTNEAPARSGIFVPGKLFEFKK